MRDGRSQMGVNRLARNGYSGAKVVCYDHVFSRAEFVTWLTEEDPREKMVWGSTMGSELATDSMGSPLKY